ncbi:helix-turn-helix domain-containing protein [Algibacillus agarilyticus]|uniref:helix-turn-helix domain-containing protein n=1 Tax=Algibacillus agarilyticus TaxID=2234133 RepID=UPI000DD017EF|nr:helix-turn-helix domain-containing protein [Algibacillus agarilyticus]
MRKILINLKQRPLADFLPFILIIVFFIMTSVIRAQELGINSFFNVDNSVVIDQSDKQKKPHIAKLVILPATLAILNFYYIFIAFQYFKKNQKRFLTYLSLCLIQWTTITWHMSAFMAKGIHPPIIDKWPLTLGFLISTSSLAIFLSLHITRLKKENMAANKLMVEQKQAHQLKIETLSTELNKTNEQAADSTHKNQDLTAKIEENKHNKFVNELTQAIDELIHKPELDCKLLASQLCMSEKTLQRKIVNSLEMTPGLFIKKSRMQKAEKLMSEQGITSRKQLAFEVGFKNVSYFSKVFDQHLEKSS